MPPKGRPAKRARLSRSPSKPSSSFQSFCLLRALLDCPEGTDLLATHVLPQLHHDDLAVLREVGLSRGFEILRQLSNSSVEGIILKSSDLEHATSTTRPLHTRFPKISKLVLCLDDRARLPDPRLRQAGPLNALLHPGQPWQARVTELSLLTESYCRVSPQVSSSLLRCCHAALPNLTHLLLEDEWLAKQLPTLSCLTNLTNLHITWSHMAGCAPPQLLSHLSTLTRLAHLGLPWPAALQGADLSWAVALRSVVITSYLHALRPAHIATLATCPGLTALDARHCRVEWGMRGAVAEALAGIRGLRELSLPDVHWRLGMGSGHLTPHLRQLSGLQALHGLGYVGEAMQVMGGGSASSNPLQSAPRPSLRDLSQHLPQLHTLALNHPDLPALAGLPPAAAPAPAPQPAAAAAGVLEPASFAGMNEPQLLGAGNSLAAQGAGSSAAAASPPRQQPRVPLAPLTHITCLRLMGQLGGPAGSDDEPSSSSDQRLPRGMADTLQQLPSLRSLTVQLCTPTVQQIAQQCTALTQLVLKDKRPGHPEDGWAATLEALQRIPALKSLHLQDTPATEAALISIAAGLPRLRELRLSYCRGTPATQPPSIEAHGRAMRAALRRKLLAARGPLAAPLDVQVGSGALAQRTAQRRVRLLVVTLQGVGDLAQVMVG